MKELLQIDIVQSLLEQANVLSQETIALFLVIGLIALVLYVVVTNIGSILKEKLGA